MGCVGIVIVTYQSGREIGACLDAALKTGAEIVVVDNASGDGTRAEVLRRGVRLIANEDNRGFAAAVNQGIQALSTEFILLLNPDAVIERGIDAMAAACSMPGVAAAGGMLIDERGAPQTGFMIRKFPTPPALICEALLLNRVWPRNPVNWQYRCLGLDHGAAQDVEQPAGAFLMVRRDVWEKLGGFDEGYRPVWFEDVDFCRRIVSAGGRIRYVPNAVAKHTGGHSIWAIGLENRRLYWYGSLLRYSARHFRPCAVRMICLAVAAGSIARTVGDVALSRSLKPIKGCGKILALAAGHLRGGKALRGETG